MLQQTQVSRVIAKYLEWMRIFPDIKSLAKADLRDVLILWQGLGYNRRARYLYESVSLLVVNGIPHGTQELVKLPGVGVNTAGAISAYVFNEPVVFIETNIRTVIIEHYFSDKFAVTDNEIIRVLDRLISATHLDARNWYWALMDYGTFLKASVKNVQKSAHYAKQATFEGSLRQLRSSILRSLLVHAYTEEQLLESHPDIRTPHAIRTLIKDKLIILDGLYYVIAK